VDTESVKPDTTREEDRKTAGQRRINVIWETTQAIIAVTITLACIYTAATKIEATVLSNAFFLVIGFYFSRTNHQRVGGVGADARESR